MEKKREKRAKGKETIKDLKPKRDADVRGGIAVSDPGAPGDKSSSTKPKGTKQENTYLPSQARPAV